MKADDKKVGLQETTERYQGRLETRMHGTEYRNKGNNM
jgi:hypothetical protein